METAADRLTRLFRHRKPEATSKEEQARLLGVNPITYRAALRRDAISKDIAGKAATRLRTTTDWILYGRGPDPVSDINDGEKFVIQRTVPVIGWTSAKRIRDFSKIKDGDMKGTHPIPEDFPGGPNCFMLTMRDDSMAGMQHPHGKVIAKGDRLIFDPDTEINIGDLVLADVKRSEMPVFRRYHSAGIDDDGNEIIDLIPLNPAYPTYRIDASRPGRLIARLVGRFDAF